jgi:hypothetical protein
MDNTSVRAGGPVGVADRAAFWPAIRERATRGLLAYNAGCVLRLAGDAWIVRGTDPGTTYRVDLDAETCDCPDFAYFGEDRDVACKHVFAVAIAHASRRARRTRTCRECGGYGRFLWGAQDHGECGACRGTGRF